MRIKRLDAEYSALLISGFLKQRKIDFKKFVDENYSYPPELVEKYDYMYNVAQEEAWNIIEEFKISPGWYQNLIIYLLGEDLKKPLKEYFIETFLPSGLHGEDFKKDKFYVFYSRGMSKQQHKEMASDIDKIMKEKEWFLKSKYVNIETDFKKTPFIQEDDIAIIELTRSGYKLKEISCYLNDEMGIKRDPTTISQRLMSFRKRKDLIDKI